MKYICDPNFGEEGILYIPEDIIPGYIEQIIPRAFMITPN